MSLPSLPSMDALLLPDHDPSDSLSIDDLLDFSSDLIGYGSFSSSPSFSPPLPDPHPPPLPSLPSSSDLPCSFPSSEEFAELEWLSHFVEESFATGDGTVLELSSRKERGKGQGEEDERGVELAYGRVRRRRGYRGWRAGECFWNTRILWMEEEWSRAMEMAEKQWSEEEELAMASSSSSGESDEELGLGLGLEEEEEEEVQKNKGKKRKRSGGVRGGSRERRCMHCGSERTPQWRAGPMGPKTLCNACGVRFKSGRLLPEYRPANSPTFTNALHSNSHRRVLEMRRLRSPSKKDTV